jgi:hypothetical protein
MQNKSAVDLQKKPVIDRDTKKRENIRGYKNRMSIRIKESLFAVVLFVWSFLSTTCLVVPGVVEYTTVLSSSFRKRLLSRHCLLTHSLQDCNGREITADVCSVSSRIFVWTLFARELHLFLKKEREAEEEKLALP